MPLSRGLYEVLITEALDAELRELDDRLSVHRSRLRAADAPDRIAMHLAAAIRRAISSVDDEHRVERGISLARELIRRIATAIEDFDPDADSPGLHGDLLRSIVRWLPTGSLEEIATPLIPLLDTTLLTNSPGEPRVGQQISAEIASADRLDVVMAFVRFSGIRPLLASLRFHCEQQRTLRILTTTYTGSTEARALDALAEIGAAVRVSYDTSTTRLHAKAWLFQRASGFSTAYIGSSNLTHSAQRDGLEWNVRVSGARNPDVIEKVAAVFESYWNSDDFIPYDRAQFDAAVGAQRGGDSTTRISPIELRPEPFQERLLEQIALSRQRGHHKNLLVSATGTGKTVMAAIDYSRLRATLKPARLLFVAHREEILQQSLDTFRHCLRDPAFGELWVGGAKPKKLEHVFASIQSLSHADLRALERNHFNVVVVDEFHHAAAATYTRLLDWIQPVELLGMTATPERADGLPILDFFDGRIAAELRLWDAIDQHRLVPFSYYGIHDGVDLTRIEWRRGRGYDIEGLSNLLTGDDARARMVADQVRKHVGDPSSMRALGFCVSVNHARFMARVFNQVGIRSSAVWADTAEADRKAALRDLSEGKINAVFSVDLFNEGIDVPTVDTLLLLRPTDSATLFLQQLGRGLRKVYGKSACTVLDFIGRHRTEFRFDRRFGALLGGGRRQVAQQIEAGFPFLPAGCHMELDAVAADLVLNNLRNSVPAQWDGKVEELRRICGSRAAIGLHEFLKEADLNLEDVYSSQRSWSDLLDAAGKATHPPGRHEKAMRRACGRLLHIDDRERIDFYHRIVAADAPPDLGTLSEREWRLVRMLVGSTVDQVVEKSAALDHGLRTLWGHPQIREELRQLFEALRDRIAHLGADLGGGQEVPLRVHARYSRLEILAAVGIGRGAVVPAWQQGVYWAEGTNADLLAFTLDKTSGQFSPTTRYRDFAISRELIHWESQNSVRAESETGRRYRRHAELGSSVFLFARLTSDDRAFWFLGPAAYVTHESERPMAITWRLKYPLPGDLFTSFAAAVA